MCNRAKTNRILKQAHLNHQVNSFPTKVKDSKHANNIWKIFLIKDMPVNSAKDFAILGHAQPCLAHICHA